jgi:sec-independent protein translocase protein TatA
VVARNFFPVTAIQQVATRCNGTLKYLSMNSTLLFLSGVGFQEILLIGVIILVFFGAKKIPDFMKGLGKGVREFKDGIKEVQQDVEKES